MAAARAFGRYLLDPMSGLRRKVFPGKPILCGMLDICRGLRELSSGRPEFLRLTPLKTVTTSSNELA
jgi:hypothetical protein